MHPEPLFSLFRDGVEEIRILGELVAVDGRGVVFQTGKLSAFPARSLLKPFQFLSAMGSDWKRFTASWRPEQVAACLGSVSATLDQVKQIESWWKDSSLRSALRVPSMFPMEETHRSVLKLEGRKPEQVFHTCFSKHLGILSGCVLHGWPLEGYLHADHPFWLKVANTLHQIESGISSNVKTVTDGCLLPTPVLEMGQLASLYRKLAVGEDELRGFGDLMMRYPAWVGGPGRLDTKWMEANPGKLLAKEGADGLWGAGIVPCDRWPSGLGIVLKLASGYHPPLAALALEPLLRAWGLNVSYEAPRGHTLKTHLDLPT